MLNDHAMDHSHDQHHIVSFNTLVGVYLSLLALTALTVAVSGMKLKAFSVVVALAVAVAKSALVLGIFMHLKFEKSVYRIFFLVTFVTLVIFIGLTFTDLLRR